MTPWARFGTPLYKNTGSVARDHLASERTFLAWTRTGLGFVALGIAIERFSQFDIRELLRGTGHISRPTRDSAAFEELSDYDKRSSRILVGALMTLGLGSVFYATGRYFSVLRYLEKGEFRPAYRGVVAMGMVTAGLAGGVSVGTIRSWEREDKEAKISFKS